jgi:hypothetical protein
MEFRVFVYAGRVTAISQYDHYGYYRHLAAMRNDVQAAILTAWADINPRLRHCPSYIVDLVYLRSSRTARLLEFSPFFPCTGAAMFNWARDAHTLRGDSEGIIEFRLKSKSDLHPQLAELMEVT